MVSHGGKESVARANRGFLSCHRDLELDFAPSLYSVLFHSMLDLAFEYPKLEAINKPLGGGILMQSSAAKQMSSTKSLDNIVNKMDLRADNESTRICKKNAAIQTKFSRPY